MSQRFSAQTNADPFEIYRALRVVNPSPYLYFLKLDDVSVVGSSPEMLVKVQGRNASYRPLAGTRPRGRNEKEDRELEAKLLADPKERAEHVMLVDLGRNDLGRVCEYGSVKSDRLMFVERYSHVMHLASACSGRLREDVDCFDALMACFPAGTLSGAPKVRAMEIIDELEPTRRGIYGGRDSVSRFFRQSRFLHRPAHAGREKRARLRAGGRGDRGGFGARSANIEESGEQGARRDQGAGNRASRRARTALTGSQGERSRGIRFCAIL